MEREIRTLAAHIASATARWLALIAEYDSFGGWHGSGAKSCAEWISWMCSVSPVAAREYVRVARRLHELPEIAGAFGRGELSYSKVRALTRLETIGDEAALLVMARAMSAAQLESVLRGYRTVRAVEEGAERAHAERSVSWRFDEDGALVLHGRLPAEQGALVVKALERATRSARRRRPLPATLPRKRPPCRGHRREMRTRCSRWPRRRSKLLPLRRLRTGTRS
jgi:hypothetical protein